MSLCQFIGICRKVNKIFWNFKLKLICYYLTCLDDPDMSSNFLHSIMCFLDILITANFICFNCNPVFILRPKSFDYIAS